MHKRKYLLCELNVLFCFEKFQNSTYYISAIKVGSRKIIKSVKMDLEGEYQYFIVKLMQIKPAFFVFVG